ncbi:uncharacterized protein F4822DRAFT_443382 [Hypoxylon trugodes]|uniref:uncharacterized protein n=1 Tax=Hypoxylon trugodes TaxID=326681 RepID=UPI0021924D0F|nr:uncharacterized protein F4822DRAFT_443382 [Hypoxylon trugodes]KAI1388314.1 hypothetical protein F4822DRAFT_443382 [Hypoxylon trugodes]
MSRRRQHATIPPTPRPNPRFAPKPIWTQPREVYIPGWSDTRPTPPPEFPFGLPRELEARLELEAAAERAFQARMSYLANSPGAPPSPPPAPGAVIRKSFVRGWVPPLPPPPPTKFVVLLLAITALIQSWKTWYAEKKALVVQRYKHEAFMLERRWWLALTAYRQSVWLLYFRLLRKILFWTLVAVVVAWLAKLKMDEREEWLEQQKYVYKEPSWVLYPEPAVWSVAKPRCDCECDCTAVCP